MYIPNYNNWKFIKMVELIYGKKFHKVCKNAKRIQFFSFQHNTPWLLYEYIERINKAGISIFMKINHTKLLSPHCLSGKERKVIG